MIGTLNENSLHASLKEWYARPGDKREAKVNGYIVDIVRGKKLIEFQTKNFSGIKTKLEELTKQYHVHVVYPIAGTKWIIRVSQDGNEISRRKSPKRGKLTEIFNELVYIPNICQGKNFSLEAVLVEVEEIWRDDNKGSWRRKGWSIGDRVLTGVTESRIFHRPIEFLGLIPDTIPEIFVTADIAAKLKIRLRLAQKMTYCLREMGVIEIVGKKGRAFQYSILD